MSDGAQQGLRPTDALYVALGEDLKDKPQMRADEMTAYLESAPADPHVYDDAARLAGKLILGYLRLHHEAAALDAANLYERMEAEGSPIADLDLTGFMLGWAVNAARRCLELDSISNPAIISPRVFAIKRVKE